MSSTKKGNILETIVEILEKSISSENTIITRNKKIIDLDGIERQIDVYVEASFNKKTFNTVIECKNYTSSINIEKIEAFSAKCLRLPKVHKRIFITASNFQSGAITKAKALNIELFKIEKAPSNPNESPLNISNIYRIEQECRVLDYQLNSRELTENKIRAKTLSKLVFENGNSVTPQDLTTLCINTPQIWSYLNTASGTLIGYKKIITQLIDVKDIYVKVDKRRFAVDSIKFKLQIGLNLKEIELKEPKGYFSLDEETTLAFFTTGEYVFNNDVYKIFSVKSEEEEKPHHYLVSPDQKESIKLSYLGGLHEEKVNLSVDHYKNVHINLLEENIPPETTKKINIVDDPSSFESLYESNKSSIHLVLIENKIFIMIPISNEGSLFFGKFPDPISMFYNHAITLYNKSVKHKSIIVKEDSDNSIILANDRDYHSYIQYLTSSVFMLHSAIELFLNYSFKEGVSFKSDDEMIDKSEFQNNLTLSEKLNLLPQYIDNFPFRKNEHSINIILELSDLNEELQNLQTSGTSIGQPFLYTFDRLLKFDMEKCLNSVKALFKEINPNYLLDDL